MISTTKRHSDAPIATVGRCGERSGMFLVRGIAVGCFALGLSGLDAASFDPKALEFLRI
jgi:hypothetical protein